MPDTSGRTSGRQFAFYDRDTSSWRMWPAISLWGSETFSGTWPKRGMTHDGAAFELPTSERPTAASACSSLLPTATTGDAGTSRTMARGNLTLQGAIVGTRPSDEARHLLPTPAAQEPGGTVEQYHERLRKADGREPTFTPLGMLVESLLPTPTTQDAANTGGASQWERNTPPLNALVSLLPTPSASDSDRGPDYAREGRTGSGGDDLVTTIARETKSRPRGAPTSPPSDDGKP